MPSSFIMRVLGEAIEIAVKCGFNLEGYDYPTFTYGDYLEVEYNTPTYSDDNEQVFVMFRPVFGWYGARMVDVK